MRKLTLALSIGIMVMFALAAFGFDNNNDPNLILWLDFDDKDTKDLSPKKTAFTAFVPGTVVEGLVEGAWQFEEGTEIGVGGAFSAAFTESTFSVWVLKSSDNGVIYDEGGGTNGLCVQMVNGQLEYCTRDGGTATCFLVDFPTNDEEWHLITAVFSKGIMELYIDGEMVEDQDGVAGIGSHANESGIGKVGAGIAGIAGSRDTGQWTGIMDELILTRRTITAQEIKDEFASGGFQAVEATGKMAVTWGRIRMNYN